MYFKQSIQALSIVLNKGLFFVWVSLSNVLNSINTPKLLGSRHFKLQTISLPMISKDKPQLAYVFKILYLSNKKEKRQAVFTQVVPKLKDRCGGWWPADDGARVALAWAPLPPTEQGQHQDLGDRRQGICYRTSRKRD